MDSRKYRTKDRQIDSNRRWYRNNKRIEIVLKVEFLRYRPIFLKYCWTIFRLIVSILRQNTLLYTINSTHNVNTQYFPFLQVLLNSVYVIHHNCNSSRSSISTSHNSIIGFCQKCSKNVYLATRVYWLPD